MELFKQMRKTSLLEHSQETQADNVIFTSIDGERWEYCLLQHLTVPELNQNQLKTAYTIRKAYDWLLKTLDSIPTYSDLDQI